MRVEVSSPSAALSLAAAQDYRAAGPGQRRPAVTAVGAGAKYGGTYSVEPGFVSLRVAPETLTSDIMQAESGIVPDFEVAEEFQEEPKTYYELKSQPLKSSRKHEAGGGDKTTVKSSSRNL
ncbi:unnamed protein product [Pleuronectes platessa]|uniref:Uncharacterized protein n=1 Tax=Pleuronectes platessa TaxID=8262 RepID=A0A9N7VFD2_PLEPL|nr:unnamed protein product [Pleuronectes platessa]